MLRITKRVLRRLFERMSHGARSDQAAVAREYLPQVELHLEEIDRQAREKAQSHAELTEKWEGTSEGHGEAKEPKDKDPVEPVERFEDRQRGGKLRSVGWLGALLESFLASYAATFWLVLQKSLAVSLGVFLALVYTWISELIWGEGPIDHTNPKPESKRRSRILWLLALVLAILLAALGCSRFADAPDWVYTLELCGLSALLPVFSAGCFVLADIIEGRNRLAREYHGLRTQAARVRSLVERMRAILSTLLLSTALFLLPGLLRADTFQVWLDTSGSLEQSISGPALGELSTILVSAPRVDQIEVFGFADGLDVLRPPSASLNLPKPSKGEACSSKSEVQSLFKQASLRQEKRCSEERSRLSRIWQAQLRALAPTLSGMLSDLERRPPSRSTCFFQVLLRCVATGPGSACVLVSDGAQENCPMVARPSTLGGAKVIVLLVPKKGDKNDAIKLLEERSRRIRAFAPGIVVVPLFQMSGELPKLIQR